MKQKSQQIEVIARGLLRHGQYILACKNSAKGYYYLPGGHVEPNETAAAALARELSEETGLTLSIRDVAVVCEVLFTSRKTRHQEYNLVFHVERMGKEAKTLPPVRSLEKGIQFEWLDQAAITDFDFRPRVIQAWIASGCQPGWLSAAE